MAGDLCPSTEPETPLFARLREVVDKADQSHSHHHENDEQPARRRRIHVNGVTEEIAQHRTEDDDDSTHCRSATFGVVTLRPIVANELAPPDSLKECDEGGSDKESEEQCEAGAQEE